MHHPNRFVRETAHFTAASVCVALQGERLVAVGPDLAERLADGLSDNWSQVRVTEGARDKGTLAGSIVLQGGRVFGAGVPVCITLHASLACWFLRLLSPHPLHSPTLTQPTFPHSPPPPLQVRYAASVATRTFMSCVGGGEAQEAFLPTLTGPMCLNRQAT